MDQKSSLTRRRALRHDQPLWAVCPRISVRTKNTVPRNTFDVIIVGAGISGALMAHALVGKGLKIRILDRREPSRGSSLASTAMIQHEIDVPLHVLAKSIGSVKAQRVWQRSARAVEGLVELVHDLNLDCSFERKRTLFLAGDAYGARALKKEAEARRDAGIDAEFLNSRTLRERYGIDRTAAIDSGISASANPAQLTAGILRNAARLGAEIVSDVEVKDVRSFNNNVVISTDAGSIIAARHVVFCTGYEFLEALANKSQRVVSTWALASRPNLVRPAWLDDYLVWEGSDPYLYFRSTPQGRVIVGGEDESVEEAYKDTAKAVAKTKTLVEKVGDLTGMKIGRPDFTWAAPFGVTPDGLPMIGGVPGLNGVYVTMGFGGNGITFSQIAAEMISSKILGHRDPDWTLFPIR